MRTVRLRLPWLPTIVVTASTAHWYFPRRHLIPHGPQTWPWWKVCGLRYCVIGVSPPSTGHRLWIYTRWGAWLGDLVVDRRTWPRAS